MKKIAKETTPLINKKEMISIIKDSLEKDERIKSCIKFRLGNALQIESKNGEYYNLSLVQLHKGDFVFNQAPSVDISCMFLSDKK